MASLRDIAERSGVSQATVSRVLNGKGQVHPDTRARVRQAAREIGYRTQTEKIDGMQRIAIAYPGPNFLGTESPFDAAIARGLARAMSEYDFDLSVIDLRQTMRAGESYSNVFQRKGVTGVILRSDDDTLHICEAIAREGIPAVLLGERSDDPSISYVNCNSYQGSRDVIEHLVMLGHETIACCVNTDLNSDHRDRMRAWRDVMDSHGLASGDNLVIRLPPALDNGASLLRRVMSMEPRPTAVFVTNPLVGVGAINEAQRMGVQVPGDLSIAGVDDSNLRLMTFPDMTSVCQDASELARRAVGALRRMVDGEADAPVRVELSAWVEVRGSTGPVVDAKAPLQRRKEPEVRVTTSPRTGTKQRTLAKGELT